jgi:hypothetical protein
MDDLDKVSVFLDRLHEQIQKENIHGESEVTVDITTLIHLIDVAQKAEIDLHLGNSLSHNMLLDAFVKFSEDIK